MAEVNLVFFLLLPVGGLLVFPPFRGVTTASPPDRRR
jgi:hypothetical protein